MKHLKRLKKAAPRECTDECNGEIYPRETYKIVRLPKDRASRRLFCRVWLAPPLLTRRSIVGVGPTLLVTLCTGNHAIKTVVPTMCIGCAGLRVPFHDTEPLPQLR